jgi:hypothetical protein
VGHALPQNITARIDQFVGRTWLLPEILRWWSHGSARTLLVTGAPGTGKSMLMAWLAGFGPPPESELDRGQLAQLRSAVKAIHFCQAASRNITPRAFAQGIANQLSRSVDGFADALAATNEHIRITGTAQAENVSGVLAGVFISNLHVGDSTDEVSFDRNLVEPLKALYAKGYSEPMLLLVDALDEAQTYSGVTIAHLLSRVADLPAPVRILATTRPEPPISSMFRGKSEQIDVSTSIGFSIDDVRSYANSRLAGLPEINRADRTAFAERLSLQANGVFLYAAAILDEILTTAASELPDISTYRIPASLSDLYHEFLQRQFGDSIQTWTDVYEPFLGLICVAQGAGVTAKVLSSIIGKDIRSALYVSKQYLEGDFPDGPFRPFHSSFSDYLLKNESNIFFRIDKTNMHARMAEHLWATYHRDWRKCDEYAAANLALHLFEANRSDRLFELISRSAVGYSSCAESSEEGIRRST